MEGLTPNCGAELSSENFRLERKCKIPGLKSQGRQAIQTLREHSFQIYGARLFNCLPQKLRDMKTSQDEFKEELDKYLSTVPDRPKIGKLIPSAVCRITGKQSNSITAWIKEP